MTAASQRKATLIKRAADAAQAAFDKYATGKAGAAEYSEFGARLRMLLPMPNPKTWMLMPYSLSRGSAPWRRNG